MGFATNKGAYTLLRNTFGGDTPDATLYLALLTAASAPTVDTNVKDSPLVEVANGNGYTTGGISVTPGDVDFDVWTEDDTNDWALVQLDDLTWTATGGAIPISGDDPRYIVLTDPHATQASREIFVSWDLGDDYGVGQDQDLVVKDLEVKLTTV